MMAAAQATTLATSASKSPPNPPIGGGEGERMSSERLTVSGYCLLLQNKMAPRNVMPSLGMFYKLVYLLSGRILLTLIL